jgi:hypothetical protein
VRLVDAGTHEELLKGGGPLHPADSGSTGGRIDEMNVVTAFGVAALTFMMVMYAFESRRPVFTLAFAGGCLLSSAYGYLAGAWPFGVVEMIWCGVALWRYQQRLQAR